MWTQPVQFTCQCDTLFCMSQEAACGLSALANIKTLRALSAHRHRMDFLETYQAVATLTTIVELDLRDFGGILDDAHLICIATGLPQLQYLSFNCVPSNPKEEENPSASVSLRCACVAFDCSELLDRILSKPHCITHIGMQ